MRTTKRSLLRHAVIGYLVQRDGWVYPLDILRSMAISSGRLYEILDELVARGLVERGIDHEHVSSRKVYRWTR